MAGEDNPLEVFRQVLTGAARAIAREPELELGFTAESPSASGKAVKVPMPGRTLPEREVAEARGFADAAALKLRHHNQALHARSLPADAIVLRDGQQVTEFREGLLPWALQTPTALVFDEYDAGRPDVMFVIQRVLEPEGKLTLLDQNRVSRPHP